MPDIKSLTVTPQTSLAEMQEFLAQAEDGDKVFGTKSGKMGPDNQRLETKTLYLAKNANLDTVKRHDRAHAQDTSNHRTTGRELIETVLKNSYAAKANDTDHGTEHAAYKTRVNTLLSNAIDKQLWDGKNWFARGDAPKAAELLDLTTLVKTTTDRTEWIGKNFKPEPQQTLPASNNRELMLLVTDVNLPGSNETVPLPTFDIGDATFVADKILGVGGFGAAVRYKEVGGDAVKIIKLPHEFDDAEITKEDLETHLADVTHERLAGEKYATPGSHVMAFNDHIVLGNGTVALIGDEGGYGDVFDFAETMHKENLDPHAKRLVMLTMTKDMGESLTALHDAGGLHNDMKPENQVVGKDGHTNLIDLGFAEPGPTVALTAGDRYTANVEYNAPEAQLHTKNLDNEVNQVRARAEAWCQAIGNELRALLEASGQGDRLEVLINNHFDTLENAAVNEAHGLFAMDGKADVYGIGGSAFMLATGKSVHELRHERAEQDLTTEDTTPTKEAVLAQRSYKKSELARMEHSHGMSYEAATDARPFDNDALVDATGDPVFDLLLDDLLAPNANNRQAERDIATHVTMQYGANYGVPAVGSEAVRTLIVAIAKGDKTEIQQAQAALLEAFPAPDSLEPYQAQFAQRAAAFTPSPTRPAPAPLATLAIVSDPVVPTNLEVESETSSLPDGSFTNLLQVEPEEVTVPDDTTPAVANVNLADFMADTARMGSRDVPAADAEDQDDHEIPGTSPMI